MEIPGSLRTEFIDTQAAKEAVLFANSPSYLLDRLRRDASVEYLIDRLSTKQIIETLAGLCSEPPKDPLDIVRGYVFLVALSLKHDLDSYQGIVNAIDLNCLQWGDELRDSILRARVPTTLSEIRYREAEKYEPSETTPSKGLQASSLDNK